MNMINKSELVDALMKNAEALLRGSTAQLPMHRIPRRALRKKTREFCIAVAKPLVRKVFP
jgi:hypothetical protein